MHSNVDPGEISKFSELAKEWWNPFGSTKPLHDINPLRLEYIEKHTTLKDLRVLDIGCGGGILSESLAKSGAHVVGIDMSHEAITIAKLHAQKENLPITYEVSTAESYAQLYPGKFDIITCMELLEHVPDPSSIIKATSILLAPQGKAFFSTLNRNLKSFLFAIVGAEYLLKLLPKGTHEYSKFIKPFELEAMLRNCDLNLRNLTGLTYHPVFKTYDLSSDISVNYLAYTEAP